VLLHGEASWEIELGAAAERTLARLDAHQHRTALVFAGMLEQAVEDAEGDWPRDAARAATAGAAHVLLGTAPEHRARARTALTALAQDRRTVVTRVPEGFACSALYPEQYAAAAVAWLDGRPGRALVIGLRSIGTTLSAIVAAVLERAGWQVGRAARGRASARLALPPRRLPRLRAGARDPVRSGRAGTFPSPGRCHPAAHRARRPPVLSRRVAKSIDHNR
jgi:hypothetical protein